MIRKSFRFNFLIAAGMAAIVVGNAAYSVYRDYENTIADRRDRTARWR